MFVLPLFCFCFFIYLLIYFYVSLRGVADIYRGSAPADAGGEAADWGLIRVIASVIPACTLNGKRQLWIVFPTKEL